MLLRCLAMVCQGFPSTWTAMAVELPSSPWHWEGNQEEIPQKLLPKQAQSDQTDCGVEGVPRLQIRLTTEPNLL